MADRGQRRDDHESAERLGRRQARRTASRRAALDPRLPGRAERPICTVPALLLEHLELLQEQGSGQEPAGLSVKTGVDREDGYRQRRLRSAGIFQADDIKSLGRTRAAERNTVPLSQPLQSSDLVDLRLSGAAED